MYPLTPIKFAIQRTLRGLGWEIRRFSLNEMSQLNQLLSHHRIDTVLDVGANIGQFATTLRQTGFRGEIISFKPLSDAHARIIAKSASDAKWKVVPRCAVGAFAGELTMNISGNSVSSTALPILRMHTESSPDSRYVRTEMAPVITLDESDAVPSTGRIFVKIDTQGFEQ